MLLLAFFSISILYPFFDVSKQIIKSQILSYTLQNGPVLPTYYLNEVIITGHAKQYSVWNHIPDILTGIYYLVAAGLIIWMLVQIAGIVSLLIKTESAEINGQKVYLKKGLKTPFSFFNYIVLDPDQYTESELQEILRHEKTHVHQAHSLDMIISDLMCVCCWFNPFTWLLKWEVRMNLEYLADRSVINSGCDTEHYQFHLLRLSYHPAAVTIVNNFNVSPLKKRIIMMNKKQTSSISILKYALIIPMVAVLLFFNSCLQANKQQASEPETALEPEAVEPEVVEPAVDTTEWKEDLPPAVDSEQKEVKIYNYTDVMPQFPGGERALLKWLEENVDYPSTAVEQGIQGKVILRFVINPEGKIENVTVQKSVDPALDKEAVRAVRSMPNWTPGKQGGNPVFVYYSLPVKFSLKK
jgi:TonB family protein